jgi:ubiquinol-cytochrome c reductase iron-sulfur subunit
VSDHDKAVVTRNEHAEPIPDPGLAPHRPRPTDVDSAAEKRAERQVAGLFLAAMAFVVAFVVCYFSFAIGEDPDTILGLGASNVLLGSTLAGAFLCIGIGIIQWARKLMGDHEIVEMRHPAASSDEDRAETLNILKLGAEESGLGRRPLVRNTLLGAVGLAGIAPLVMLRDLGPLPGDALLKTIWDEGGLRVVRDVVGTPIKPSDLEVGDLVNAEPEPLVPVANPRPGVHYLHGHDILVEKTKSAIILLRMPPKDIKSRPDGENWDVDGIVCYSKICTHVGCPIALNERMTHHLLCPCHQSTFDLADNGRVVFGPAARALPQLKLAVDDEGYLIAPEGFHEPVGPSFWERDSKDSL